MLVYYILSLSAYLLSNSLYQFTTAKGCSSGAIALWRLNSSSYSRQVFRCENLKFISWMVLRYAHSWAPSFSDFSDTTSAKIMKADSHWLKDRGLLFGLFSTTVLCWLKVSSSNETCHEAPGSDKRLLKSTNSFAQIFALILGFKPAPGFRPKACAAVGWLIDCNKRGIPVPPKFVFDAAALLWPLGTSCEVQLCLWSKEKPWLQLEVSFTRKGANCK